MLLSAARVSARVQSLPSEFYAAYLKKFWLAHTAARRFFLRYWLRDLLQEQVVYVRDGAAVVRAADLPAKPAGAVRLCVVSDTHTYHDALRVPPGDALVHCGDVLRADVTRGDGEAQLRRLGAWLAAQDHGRVLVTGGNHDRTLEASSPARVAELLGPRVEYVAHGGVDVGGARLFLSPYSNPNTARSRNSAFQGKTHGDALCANFAKFHASKAVDVLCTHGPPAGVLDGGRGSRRVARLVDEFKPAYHVFGHQHNRPGTAVLGGTTFVNCSNTDGRFQRPATTFERFRVGQRRRLVPSVGWFAVTKPPVVLDVVPGSAARGGSSDWRVDVAAARLDVVAPEDDAKLEPGTEERM